MHWHISVDSLQLQRPIARTHCATACKCATSLYIVLYDDDICLLAYKSSDGAVPLTNVHVQVLALCLSSRRNLCIHEV
jgi:hypothetical protein